MNKISAGAAVFGTAMVGAIGTGIWAGANSGQVDGKPQRTGAQRAATGIAYLGITLGGLVGAAGIAQKVMHRSTSPLLLAAGLFGGILTGAAGASLLGTRPA